jgi:hypothetical protein
VRKHYVRRIYARRVECQLHLSDFGQTLVLLTNVGNSPQYRLHESPTGWPTDSTKLTAAFRSYLVNEPKMDVKEWDGKLCNDITHFLCDPSVHYRVHNSPLLLPILSHIYPINIGTTNFPPTPVLTFSSMFFQLKFSTLSPSLSCVLHPPQSVTYVHIFI